MSSSPAWSKSEIAKLERLAAAGLSIPQMADEFPERTIRGIRMFCRKHEIDVAAAAEPSGPLPPIHSSRLPNYEGLSLTSLLMGDPPIGRRAIDQRGGT